jgi:excisionase family DNA binding protein
LSTFEHDLIETELHSSSRLLTAEQLADRWQVSKAQVYRLARDSRIPAVPIGRYYRFRVGAIEAWEASQEFDTGA